MSKPGCHRGAGICRNDRAHGTAVHSKSTVTRQERKVVEVPEYDFTRHQRSERTRRVPPADVIVVEGILILHMQRIREMLNMKIFVDTDDDVRLARR